MPQCGTRGDKNKSLRWLVVVFFLALGVRLLSVWQTSEVATVRHLIGDAAGYMSWARRLADGAWIGTESFYQAPLYPYVLGALHKIIGSSVMGVRITQCVWGALGCVLVGYAARRLFGSRAGWIAALMLGCYAPAIYYDGIIQKASLSCLLSCAVVACVAGCQGRMRGSKLFVLGVVVGLLCVTRENALVWLGVLGVWVLWRAETQNIVGRLCAGTLYGSGALMVLLPALMHNVYVSGDWSLTTSQSGPNFYIGNSAEADGRYRPLVRGHETPSFERRDATRLAEMAAGRPLSPGEVSAYWLARSWEDIAADPWRWVGLLGRKALMTTNRYEVADGDSMYVHARSSWLLSWLGAVWHFGVLFPLGVFGLVAAWTTKQPVGVFVGLLLSMIVAVTLFFVLGRYRLPLVPVLVPLAAYGVVRGVDWVRSGAWRLAGGGVVVAVPLAVLCNLPVHGEGRLNALAAMNAGVALAQMGEVDESVVLFEQAVAAHPASVEANYNLAMALAETGRYKEAIPHYRKTLAGAPMLPGAEFNLGVAWEHIGAPAKALAHYETAVAQDPKDAAARQAVARLRGRR